MFLEALRLNNFRSFEDERIQFSKDLTILAGEDTGGKSDKIWLSFDLYAALRYSRYRL